MLKNDRRSFDCSEVQCPLSLSEEHREPASAKSNQVSTERRLYAIDVPWAEGTGKISAEQTGERRAKPRGFRNNFDRTEMVREDRTGWLGREDSNLRMAESKSAALPLGYAPMRHRMAAGRGPGRAAQGGAP